MEKIDLNLLSWSMYKQGRFSSKTDIDGDVVKFIERLSILPEAEQLKVINAAERIFSKL